MNQIIFSPGDYILFAGNQTYTGKIRLDSNSKGTTKQKITIASYGKGQAVIDGGNNEGLVVDGCRHLLISSLKFIGSGRKQGNITDGIQLINTDDVTVSNIELSGFRGAGIATIGDKKSRITHVYTHDNGFAGIAVRSAEWKTITEDLYIAHCTAENNPGDPSILDNHSGNGIVVSGVKGGVIEFCEAMKNGWDMPREGNGPVGIWAYDSDRVIIQHCISHHNQSPGMDGGGFDFDGGMTNSIMQYNLSFHNVGAGYGLFQYHGAQTWKSNIIRYNISIDDGQKNSHCGIHIWAGSENMSDAEIYNNTVINRTGYAVNYDTDLDGLNFCNNILIAKNTPIHGPHSRSKYMRNLYWCINGKLDIGGYHSIEEWSLSTGQENMGSKVIGLYADPRLIMPDLEDDIIVKHKSPNILQVCLLQADSPCICAGITIQDNGGYDFWGNRIPIERLPSIGAHEKNQETQ